jgi:hypothetical protein
VRNNDNYEIEPAEIHLKSIIFILETKQIIAFDIRGERTTEQITALLN